MRLHWPRPVWFIVLVGSCLSLLTGYGLIQTRDSRMAAALDREAQETVNLITDRLKTYEYGLRGARGALVTAGLDRVTCTDFARYHTTRDLAREFPGAHGFGWIRRVEPADVPAWQARHAKTPGCPAPTLRVLTPHSGPYYLIELIEPLALNQAAVGLDIASEPRRKQAADQAAATGQATITAPITLIQASGQPRRGFLVLLPIYQATSPSPTASQERVVLGWSYAPMVIDRVVSDVLQRRPWLSLSLHDTQSDPDGTPFFTNTAAAVAHTPGTDVEAAAEGLSRQVQREVYGRRWTFTFSTRPDFVADLHLPSPSLAVLAGCAITAVLALLAHRLTLAQQRERVAQKAHTRLATLVAHSTDAIIGETLDGRVTDWNHAAELIFGWRADEAIGRPLAELIGHSGHPLSTTHILALASQGQHLAAFDTTRQRRDGSVVDVSIAASPIIDNTGRIIGVGKSLRDITARRDQERQRIADNEAKSALLANVSHEMRTPLNAIVGFTHVLAQSPLEPSAHQLVERIELASRSLLAVINDVLDLSKIEAGQLSLVEEPFSLPALVKDVQHLLAPMAQAKGLAFQVVWQGQPAAAILGDAQRLQQILTNLLSNAIKFTDAGGVTLRLGFPGDPPDGLRIQVQDTGIGMSPDTLKHIFEPFSQADNSTTRRYGGTGLGLSIVQHLTGLMHGTVSVCSHIGQGSEFTVELPLRQHTATDPPLEERTPIAAPQAPTVPEPHEAAPATPATSDQRWLEGLCVLVVDDSELNRDVAQQLLVHEGATVLWAEHGRQALEVLQNAAVHIDAVLLDLHMPEMDGYETARRIRQNPRWRRLPLIAATAGLLQDERHQAQRAGMQDFLAKPISPAKLIQVLRDAVQRATGSAPAPVPRLHWHDTGLDQAFIARAMNRMLQEFVPQVQAYLVQEPPEPPEPPDSEASALAFNAPALAAMLHKLHGSALIVGIPALQDATAAAQAALRQSSQAAVWRPPLQTVAQCLAQLHQLAPVAPVSPLVPPPQNPWEAQTAPDTTGESSSRDAARLCQTLLRLVQQHDLAALTYLSEHAPALRQHIGAASFEALAQAIHSLSFEQAAELCKPK